MAYKISKGLAYITTLCTITSLHFFQGLEKILTFYQSFISSFFFPGLPCIDSVNTKIRIYFIKRQNQIYSIKIIFLLFYFFLGGGRDQCLCFLKKCSEINNALSLINYKISYFNPFHLCNPWTFHIILFSNQHAFQLVKIYILENLNQTKFLCTVTDIHHTFSVSQM